MKAPILRDVHFERGLASRRVNIAWRASEYVLVSTGLARLRAKFAKTGRSSQCSVISKTMLGKGLRMPEFCPRV